MSGMSVHATLSGIIDRIPAPAIQAVRRYSTVTTFLAGFLFDALTMQRIDAWADLAIQLAYLVGLTALLLYQHREDEGLWRPAGFVARAWRFNLEALHFLYGGLLSAYVVLYFKSSTGARPIVFLGLLVGLMLINEVPQIRHAGHRLRLGLYAFCLVSFLNYFVPILLGRIDGVVFVLSLLLSAAVAWRVADWLSPSGEARPVARVRMFAPAAAVCGAIGLLYVLKLIPPVPLSVQFQGIYHDIRRDADGFALVYRPPPAWRPWGRDSRPFERREGDRLYYFARVFAPSRFSHRVVIRFEVFDAASGAWITTDRIPFSVVGGRAEGFRGWAVKSNFWSGRWRVTAETEDDRAIATLTFRVLDDRSTGDRRWRIARG
jgi:hypothetical protein